MKLWSWTTHISRIAIFCLVVVGASQETTLAQSSSGAESFQAEGIAKIDHWTDYVLRTGDAKSTLNELVTAESDLRSSYDLFLKDENLASATWSAIKLADIKRLQNQFDQAETMYHTAIELAQRAHRVDYETKALARLAWAELRLHRMDAAMDYVHRAVSLGPNCGNKTFYFEALDVAGSIEVATGNLVAAADFLDRALTMSAEISDKKQLYTAYLDRADIYYHLATKCDYQHELAVCYQSLELARADYQRAFAITEELHYQFASQSCQGFLKELDELKASMQELQRSDQTAADAEFSPRKPEDVLVTESFSTGRMNPEFLAIAETKSKEFQDWRSRMQQQGLILLDIDPAEMFLEGELAEWKGNDEVALATFRHSLDLLEQDRRKLRDEQARLAFLEDRVSFYYHAALLLLDRKKYPEAFALFEQSRSRVMADMLASRPLNLGTARERELFSQLQTLKLNIAAQQEKLFNHTGSNDRDQHGREIVELETRITGLQQRYQELETRIAHEAPKLKQLTSSEPVTLESVQSSAREGGYDVLYYAVLESAFVLWHINESGVQVRKVFLSRNQLVKKMAGLQELLLARKNDPTAKFDETTSRELFLYLIQPILSFISSSHLVVIPHEELNSLPFQVLQNPQTGKFLGESFAISYAPSATVLATVEKQSNLKNGHLLAVADPGMHDAQDEVVAIGRLYPGRSRVVTQSPTDKGDLKTWVSDYNLIHLSVHGSFNASDPLLSYLQFKETPLDNGRLTAADMFGLPLQKNSLVVLSACETGRVEATHANEILGMVRSLLFAGAGNLVLSSWQVDAASTKLWMATFYREGQRNPPAEAARQALIAVKSRPEYSHPFFWAPFSLTGK